MTDMPKGKDGAHPSDHATHPDGPSLFHVSALRVGIVCAALYAIVALVTFGHSAAEQSRFVAKNCATAEQRQSAPTDDCYQSVTLNALAAAVLWPLYWSWEAQS